MTTPPPPPPPPPADGPFGQPQPSQQPPPPPAPPYQSGPASYPTAPPPAPGYPPAHGYPPQGKPPRPRATIGGALLLVAAVLVMVGCFLPWVSINGVSGNGFDDGFIFEDEIYDAPGSLAAIGSVLLLAFGITLLAAGRILAIAIISLVAAGLGLLVSLFYIVMCADMADTYGGDVGIGVILQPIGAVLAIAASIIALVQRRPRQPAAGGASF